MLMSPYLIIENISVQYMIAKCYDDNVVLLTGKICVFFHEIGALYSKIISLRIIFDTHP